MTTTAAQDEFNHLLRDQDHDSRHPEDRLDDSDLSDPESPGAAADYFEKPDTDDELEIPANMRPNYYIPSLRSEANTGPKGVIADAQAFEQAKKNSKKFTPHRDSSPSSHQYEVKVWHDAKNQPDEDGDDSFMKEWRAARLKELQNVGQRMRSRTNSPTRRIYGNMPLVDSEGCFNALMKTPRDTTVVVFIYDETSTSSALESCMHQVAKRNDTTRFVMLHNSDAEIPSSSLPAVMAYKQGEATTGVNNLHNALAVDDELTALSLETLFRKYRIL